MNLDAAERKQCKGCFPGKRLKNVTIKPCLQCAVTGASENKKCEEIYSEQDI